MAASCSIESFVRESILGLGLFFMGYPCRQLAWMIGRNGGKFMNRVFKVIWSHARNAYVVVSEIALNHGKNTKGSTGAVHLKKALIAALLVSGTFGGTLYGGMDSYALELENQATATYDANGNLAIGKNVKTEGKNNSGSNNTAIGTDTDTIRDDGTGNGQAMDGSSNTKLVDGEGQAHELERSTEASSGKLEGSTALGYDSHAEGDASTAIGNKAAVKNAPTTYYADADGNKTTSQNDAAWYADNDGKPTKVPQVFRDADNKTTTTPQYIHTYTEKDATTGQTVTKTEITTDAAKADKNADGSLKYNYQKADNLDKLYSVTLYQPSSNSIAAGSEVEADGENAVAVGYQSTAKSSAVAIGDNAKAEKDTVAIGKEANASAEGGVALGMGSTADRASGVAGWDPKTGTNSQDTTAVWKSGNGAISVGNGEGSRQITNVAAGSEDSDAVNVAQLKKSMIHYYSVKTTEATDQAGNNNYLNDGATGNNALAAGVSAIASGDNATAVGTESQAQGQNAAAYGYKAIAFQEDSTAMGSNAQAQARSSTAYGSSAIAKAVGSTVIGFGSTAQGESSVAIGGHALADDSVQIGTSSTSQGKWSVAVGGHTKGENSVAVGVGTTAQSKNSVAVGGHALGENSVQVGSGNTAQGKNSVAVGGTATGSQSVSVGNNANATSESATTVGFNTSATASQSTALGYNAHAGNYQSVAIGGSTANGNQAVAIGSGAAAGSYNSGYSGMTAVGQNSHANGNGSTALGNSTNAGGLYTSAIGYGSNAYGSYTMAMGGASVNGTNSIAVGNSATAQDDSSIAFGSQSNVTSSYGTAIGVQTKTAYKGTAVGYGVQAGGSEATAIGVGSMASGANATAIGGGGAWKDNSVAIGSGAGTNTDAVSIGKNSNAWGEGGVSVGTGSSANGANSTAIGGGQAHSADSVAIGSGAGTNTSAVSIGKDSNAWGENGVSLGTGSSATGKNSTAIGGGKAYSDEGIAIGSNAQTNKAITIGKNSGAWGDSAIAIGEGTNAWRANSIVLGKNSESGADKNIQGFDPITGKASTDSSATWNSTDEAVSFGRSEERDEKGNVTKTAITRQLNNVAAGTQDTDAVNVAQLKLATTKINMHYYSVHSTVTGDGSNYANDGASGVNAMAAGPSASAKGDLSVAVGNGAAANGAHSVAVGNGAAANGTDAIALGTNAKADGQGALVVGEHNSATGQNAVAFGINTVAKAEGTVAFGNGTQAGSNTADSNGNHYGQDAVAFGRGTKALGGRSLAFGEDTVAGYNNSVAFGHESEALSTGAVAFSNRTRALAQYSTAFGNRAVSAGNYATAFGTDTLAGVKTDASGAMWLTNGTKIDSNGNVAYTDGSGNTYAVENFQNVKNGQPSGETHSYVVVKGADGKAYIQDYHGDIHAVTLTKQADGTIKAAASTDITKGVTLMTAGPTSTNGYDFVDYDNATAFGDSTKAINVNATAFGKNSVASGENSLAFGEGSTAAGNNSVAGLGGNASTANSIALGKGTKANNSTENAVSVAIGENAEASGTRSLAIGFGIKDKNDTVLTQTTASGESAVSIGTDTEAAGEHSIAMGSHSEALKDSSVAIGYDTHATEASAVAIGSGTKVNRGFGVAIGLSALAGIDESDPSSPGATTYDGAQTTAMGYYARATASNATALGAATTANINGGVALGYKSATTRAAGNQVNGVEQTAYLKPTSVDSSNSTWTSTAGAVSVGNVGAKQSITRQITDVAAGSLDTDAVNVAQLKAATIHDYSVNSTNPDSDTNYWNKGATGKNALAAGVSATAQGENATALGMNAYAQYDNSLALGGNASAVNAENTMAIGAGSNASSKGAMAIGNGTVATDKENAMAIGNSANASSTRAIAIGTNALATNSDDALAIGTHAGVSGTSGTALGHEAYVAAGENGLAIGTKSGASGNNSIAIGTGAVATTNGWNETTGQSTAIGYKANASGINDTAIGANVNVSGRYSVALGSDGTTVSGYRSVGIGVGANTSGNSSVAMGDGSNASGNQAVAIGVGTNATDTASIAIGNNSRSSNSATAIGDGALASGTNSLAIGRTTTDKDNNTRTTHSTGRDSMALGNGANAWGNGSLAFGKLANAGEDSATGVGNAVAIGTEANAWNENAVALGTKSGAAKNSIAVGSSSSAWKENAMALGNSAIGAVEYGIALGEGATVTNRYKQNQWGSWVEDTDNPATGAVAIGNSSLANVEGGVALGKGSKAVTAKSDVAGYDVVTGIASAEKTTVWHSTSGAVSVGDVDSGLTRRINGVAAGSEDTDAVNVAQLKRVKAAMDSVAGAHTKVTVNDKSNPTIATAGDKTYGDYAGGEADNLHIAAMKGTDGKLTYNIKLNDQLNIGKKGADGTDGKVTVDTKGGTTVIIGHDGENGKDGKDGLFVRGNDGKDGKSGISITGPNGLDGKDGIDGTIGIAGKDGKDAVSLSGKDGVGHIGLTGPKGADGKDGTSIDLSTDYRTKTLNPDKNTTVNGEEKASRIVYRDAKGDHEVATMDDGQKYAGDNYVAAKEGAVEKNTIIKKLNERLDIKGGATGDLTDNNIGVNAVDDVLKVQLAQKIDLTEKGSVTMGKTVVNNDGLKITNDGADEKKDVTISGDKVSFGGIQVNNMGSGASSITGEGDNKVYKYDVDTNGANIGDVKKIAGNTSTELTARGLDFAGNNTDVTVHRDLGTKLTIKGEGTKEDANYSGENLKVIGNTNGTLTIVMDKDIKGNSLTVGEKGEKGSEGQPGRDGVDGKIGVNGKDGSAVVINGKDGSIGLNGKDGANGLTIRGANGAVGVDGTDGKDGKDGMTRIVYQDAKGGDHTVATMDDGQKYHGDFGAVANVALNHQVNIVGDVSSYNAKNPNSKVDEKDLTDGTANVGVVTTTDKDGNATLTIKLNRNLKGFETVAAGTNAVFGKQEVTNTGNGKETGDYVTGLDNKTWDGKTYVSGRAATEDQLHQAVSDLIGPGANGGFGLSANGGKVTQALGKTIAVNGDGTYKADGTEDKAGNISTSVDKGAIKVSLNRDLNIDSTTMEKTNDDGSKVTNKTTAEGSTITKTDANGKTTASTTINAGSLTVKDGDGTTTIGGGTATIGGVTINGKGESDSATNKEHTSTITGLSNKTFDTKNIDQYKDSGRAATEAQLKEVYDKASQHTTVTVNGNPTTDGNLKLDTTINRDGSKNYAISLNNDITLGDKDNNGKLTVKSQDGTKSITTNGEDGTLTFKDGKNEAAMKAAESAKGVDGTTDIKRVAIDNHTVATMDDGMQFAGDSGKPLKQKLNSKTNIRGGATGELSDGNIGVVSDGNDTLTVKLAKDIKGLNSVEATTINATTVNSSTFNAGNTTIDNSGVTIKTGDSGRTITIKDGGVSMGGNQIHNVAPGTAPDDAVNVSQLNATNGVVNKLGSRINKVGAGAAALAALHPLDFDPDDKWDVAAGYGHYKNADAAAIGAFYQPNEDTMLSIGGSFGGGENMVNAGISVKLGQGNHVSTSRVAMAKEIKDLRENVAKLNDVVNRQSALIDKLTGVNAGTIEDKGNDLFPDVPANHWAYEYVTALHKAGILKGYPDGTFGGDRMMTRYEFAAIVYRAIMAGAASNPALNRDGTLDKLAKEFSSEMKYIRIDTISKDRNGNPDIQRVRVIPQKQEKK